MKASGDGTAARGAGDSAQDAIGTPAAVESDIETVDYVVQEGGTCAGKKRTASQGATFPTLLCSLL